MKKQIKAVIAILVVLLIVAIALRIIVLTRNSDTYQIGNYGVSISVPKKYIRQKNNQESQLLFLKNKESGITISATQLRGEFWESGEMNELMNQYASLISVAQFDSSVTDISGEIKHVGDEPIGIVEMTVSRNVDAKRVVTVLTAKTHGYLAIEIYGKPDDVIKNDKEIRKIIDSIKFGINRHNYALDIPKEVTPEEEREGLEKLYKMFGLEYSGDLSGELLINRPKNESGE